MTARRLPVAALAVLAVLLAGACGTDDGSTGRSADEGAPGESGGLPAGGGDVPTTQRAVAAIALEHLPRTPHLFPADVSSDLPRGTLGAGLRYDPTGESDGRLVEVMVGPPLRLDLCEGADGCVRRTVEGGELVRLWELEEPEEDGGHLVVLMVRDDEVVYALNAADTITGDPRELDLRFPVEDLEELVQDERLGLTTSRAAVDAGSRIECWRTGPGRPCADGGTEPEVPEA